ncbi:hypothetical protein SHKM778_51930 [Streptomyces sp. KM77-8]|uniref:Histidine kinase n=1 Tax=Streptomyces haneummycinicus TaxID=3074435 RepID=A0AAT9HN06_9ACTN
MAGFLGRFRPVVTARPLTHQVFALQVVIVLLLALAAAAALVLQARADTEREARNRALAVARTFAQAPGCGRRWRPTIPARCCNRARRRRARPPTWTSSS